MTSATGYLSITQISSHITVIALAGTVDRSTVMRVVRLVDSRVRMAELGQVRTRHLLIDLTRVDRMCPGSGPLLRTAWRAAGDQRLGVHRIGRPKEAIGPDEQQALAGLPFFPDLRSATSALDNGVPDPEPPADR